MQTSLLPQSALLQSKYSPPPRLQYSRAGDFTALSSVKDEDNLPPLTRTLCPQAEGEESDYQGLNPSCVTLGMLVNLSESQFPALSNGENKSVHLKASYDVERISAKVDWWFLMQMMHPPAPRDVLQCLEIRLSQLGDATDI